MSENVLHEQLRSRLQALAIPVSEDVLAGCLKYLDLLHKWNQRFNLTGFDLSRPTQAALDRLVAEALAAARLIEADDRIAVDVGTGSGSPAIGLKLACPWLQMVWFEARSKKAAFLREAVRSLELTGVRVVTERFGDSRTRQWVGEDVDVVTVRAVRLSRDLIGTMAGLTATSLRAILFAVNQPISRSPEIMTSIQQETWKDGPLLTVATIRGTDGAVG